MSRFKVLLLDGIDTAGVQVLSATRMIEAVVEPTGDRKALLEMVPDFDGLIVRSVTKVDRELLEKATRLRVVGRAGVGVDNVDVEAATERGVVVMNSPGGSTTTTAEHTIGMMFALSRNIPQAYYDLRNRTWDRTRFKGVELAGKTLGVVGLGRIGSEVAHKAEAIGMKVLAYDPFISPEADLSSGFRIVEFEALLAEADFITVHTPLTSQTRDLINRSTIASMKDGVRLINCARGGIVNERDLGEALDSGKVAGAAFDVFENEPDVQSPLLEKTNFIATPHLGASTFEAQRKVSVDICGQIADFLVKDTVRGALNFPQLEAGQLERYSHFLDLATRLAAFVSQIYQGRIASVSIRYSGDVCNLNPEYLTTSIVCKLLVPILGEGVNLINATTVAKQRGIKVEETRAPVPENFTNLVVIEVRTDRESRSVSGTVFTDKLPRIVNIDGYPLDVVPRGHMLFMTNNDKPGVIGAIGTLLGETGVNVAGMHLGREREGGKALAVLLLDAAIGDDVVGRVRGLEHILSAEAIEL